LNEFFTFGFMEIKFFTSPGEMRSWFELFHDKETELLVGYYKTATGRPSITWSESVDVALCYGWIDGIRRSIDTESYCIRFTPRRPKSIWSAINIAKVEKLNKLGLMTHAGLAAYNLSEKSRQAQYSYENESVELSNTFEKNFRSNTQAWTFFSTQPSSYRKVAIRWVMSAKQADTRLKRLGVLISDSEKELRIKPLRRETK
jgi:uncharacterized protein YdeI (YjbR/CyaY-like superfamily)